MLLASGEKRKEELCIYVRGLCKDTSETGCAGYLEVSPRRENVLVSSLSLWWKSEKQFRRKDLFGIRISEFSVHIHWSYSLWAYSEVEHYDGVK